MLIYKIMTASQWSTFQKSGQFTGAPVDLADGFIHFSTAAQMRETAAKHFAGANDLVLVWGEDGPLGAELKWEVSRICAAVEKWMNPSARSTGAPVNCPLF